MKRKADGRPKANTGDAGHGRSDVVCVHYGPLRPEEMASGGAIPAPIAAHCLAGIDLTTWRRPPCFLDDFGNSFPHSEFCEHLRRPTISEIDRFRASIGKNVSRLQVVLTHILGWRRRYRGQAFSEIISCPSCGGKLHLSISGRGQVRGRCETLDCVSWVEG